MALGWSFSHYPSRNHVFLSKDLSWLTSIGLGVFPLSFSSLELVGIRWSCWPYSIPSFETGADWLELVLKVSPLTRLELTDLGVLPLTCPLEPISLQVFLLPWRVFSHILLEHIGIEVALLAIEYSSRDWSWLTWTGLGVFLSHFLSADWLGVFSFTFPLEMISLQVFLPCSIPSHILPHEIGADQVWSVPSHKTQGDWPELALGCYILSGADWPASVPAMVYSSHISSQ